MMPIAMNRFLPVLAVLITGLPAISWPLHAADATEERSMVQMLLPGFTVRELPLSLHNINNFVYAPDGRLFALAYDGNVLQLKDTDGDGLEDASTFFYKNDQNEIRPSIGMAWGPGGLYIASQERVIHLHDNGDGTASLKTVTGGWVPPVGKAGSSLDSVGLAVDAHGQIFFGLGCDNWQNAYLPNKDTGKSDYNIKSERGTIIRLSPDWKTREPIATGLRFTVSLAFNAAGDLFCTDQEGATWLPNGNPFDELLHIQPGRHYGFPPRHPKFLPNVIDEPSVFDYAPQHQSTCGLHFNEPVAGTKNIFGPKWWQGDALVSGESRGKIWRTKLVKTAAGYVAQNNLIACLGHLTVDAVPTPQGDVLVACHTGKPDWGTGPSGTGKLFKISYTGHDSPQPILAYAASPTETRIVFDRALSAGDVKNLSRGSTVAAGRYVAAGDRFESFQPGYQAVKDQRTLPRTSVNVLSTRVLPDKRTVVIQTDSRVAALNYAVTLPEGALAVRPRDESRRELSQRAAIDLLTDLTGVETTLADLVGKTIWRGWLPHLDLTAARGFTAASEEHQRLFKSLKKSGTLTLRAQLDLHLMLRTAIQPGANPGFEYPAETVTVRFKANGPLSLKSTGKIERLADTLVQVTTQSAKDRWLPVEIELATNGREPALEVSWVTTEDSRPRPLPLRRILLPWARPAEADAIDFSKRNVPEIAGGDWERGRKVFLGEQAACFKCHQIRGSGGKIGPDLSNLIYRDYASVLKDILTPSAAINPNHLAYTIELKDGETLTGVVLDQTARELTLGQANGASLTVPRQKIARLSASSISLMPEGLWQGLNAADQRDLMTFLLTLSPKENKN